MRSPDFICIGAQKAGTTWLYTQLSRHPQVWMPAVKEIHYFDQAKLDSDPSWHSSLEERLALKPWRTAATTHLRQLAATGTADELLWWTRFYLSDRDDRWYKTLFASAPADTKVGEITPRYAICNTLEIARMHEVAPATKLLLMLRNPVDRFWSQCLMKQAANPLATNSMSEILDLFESPNGRPRGNYSTTILEFCRFFDPSQILVVFFDSIATAPSTLMAEVFDFLGLSEISIPEHLLGQKVNAAALTATMPEDLRRYVTRAYRSEMEILASAFGGPSACWLSESMGLKPTSAPPTRNGAATRKLTQHHLTLFAAHSGSSN